MKDMGRFTASKRNWEGFAATDPMWAILTAPDKRGKWDVEEFLASGRRGIDILLGELEAEGVAPAPGRALDFGCGLGRLTLPLADRFESVVGVDVSARMVEQARELAAGRDNVTYVHNTEPDLGCLESAQFDFICSLITLQHVPPEVACAYIAEFVRLLAPGGVALFQVPSRYEGPRLKRALRHLPQSWISVLWRLVYRTSFYMEMNAVPRKRVEDIVARAGGTMLRVLPDRSAGNQWESWRYVVGRDGA